jgi:hypothetical protein
MSVSLMSEDFPLPLTPLTPIKHPRGILMSTFLRLLPVAPNSSMNLPFPFRRTGGISIFFIFFL